MREWLARVMDPTAVAFTTPDVGRIFLACERCGRVVPHYKVYAARTATSWRSCPCGHGVYRYRHLPEWQAAWWVLSRYVWRRLVCRQASWDPRVPVRGVP